MQRATKLQELNLADAAAEGRLLAVVQNMLISHDFEFGNTAEQWAALREAYDTKMAAHRAVLEFLYEPVHESAFDRSMREYCERTPGQKDPDR